MYLLHNNMQNPFIGSWITKEIQGLHLHTHTLYFQVSLGDFNMSLSLAANAA